MTTDLDLPAIGCAVAAAVLFSVANNVQRDAASQVPLAAGGPVRLVLRLVRTPRWIAGSALAVVALGLHAAALARGGVILVQSILASSLLVALGIEAAKDRRALRGNELAGSAVLVVGVLLLLVGGRPGGGRPAGTAQQVATGLVLALVVAIGLAASRRRNALRSTAVVMGACAGGCFAVDAVFLKGVATTAGALDLRTSLMDLLGFAVASAFGNLIVQRAYQRAALRVVLPAVTAADPLVAFVLGRWLLQERLQGGAGATLAVAFGLTAMAAGIVLTTASRAAGPTRQQS